MSFENSNTTLNNIIINNKEYFNENTYNNQNIIKNTITINIKNTTLTFNKDLNILFCKACFINLNNTNYLQHLKQKHINDFKIIKNNNIENFKIEIENLNISNLEFLENNLRNNKYYFKELLINYNGFKCIECDFININYKNIRIHFNSKHNNNKNTNKNTKAIYILKNIPLQVLESFKNNKKLYFIPILPNINNSNNLNKQTLNSSLDNNSNSSFNNNSNSNSSLSSNTKNTIINNYNKEKNINNFKNSLLNTNNIKLLNSFIKKSNILKFLKYKN